MRDCCVDFYDTHSMRPLALGVQPDEWLTSVDTKASLVTIANFICPALKEGIVCEVFWVVPDATWESARTHRPVWQQVKVIAKGFSKVGSGVN